MRILLIEDDHATARGIEKILKAEGYICDTTDMGEDGLEIGKIYEYDLIILDLMLPDLDGFDVLKRLRSSGVETPVLVLSGISDINDKVRGFSFGADDYLTKPFSKEELLARVAAIVRRFRGHSDSVIRLGDLTVSLKNHIAEVRGQAIPLTGKEYAILELMALRKGATLTKEMFLNHLYGGIDEPELKIIDVFICKLRRKIAEFMDGDDCIDTVWGRGYVLRDPLTNEQRLAQGYPPLKNDVKEQSHA
ncbi:MAG: response regulator transcription factor [Alphaproteobacteria bacterium]|nr:response regulator transcription factor [Alphaproteobacteria bacterium]